MLQIASDYLFILVTCNKPPQKQSCTNELAIQLNRRESRLPFSLYVSHECQRSSTLLDKLSRPHSHQLKCTVRHATAISEIILKAYVYTNLHIIYNLSVVSYLVELLCSQSYIALNIVEKSCIRLGSQILFNMYFCYNAQIRFIN